MAAAIASPRPRLAVQPLLITAGGSTAWRRYARGFSRARCPLALVAADDRRLDLAGATDDVRGAPRRAGEELIEVSPPRASEQRRIGR